MRSLAEEVVVEVSFVPGFNIEKANKKLKKVYFYLIFEESFGTLIDRVTQSFLFYSIMTKLYYHLEGGRFLNIGQTPVPEAIAWIEIVLLVFIAFLLLVLINKVRKIISLLKEKTTVQPVIETNLPTAAGIPEEDLAVIMAVMAQMLPGVGFANIQIKPVAK